MEKVFERTYGDYLQLQGAIEHFMDDLCGEFDTNTENETISIVDSTNNIYESVALLENGTKLNIEVSLWEFEELETDEKNYEWNCFAYKTV